MLHTTKNRKTNTDITMIEDDGVWILNCDDHDQSCEFESKRQALMFRAAPDNFCSDCSDKVGA